MTSDRIFEETTPYTVLLYRKDRELRLWEVGGFLIGMIPLLSLFPFRSAPFVVSLLVLAAAVMAGMPALYRAVIGPGTSCTGTGWRSAKAAGGRRCL